ncbi:MAG: Ldh family oxidoreductase [Rhodoplanes sp.]|uniref:Ldh family oxidoreductase n=1 Tax=Rhodoplanes sp. TaxID=1968906 RepID=UPI0017D4914E|nr:Ldh family oxidoreductase [Rhodoplanes sp.]NVO16213.1 Ldh family oxidoreductase [Rhodoplanes sp.]
MTSDGTVEVDAGTLVERVAALFVGAGLSASAARTVATALVDAELDGVASHGIAMVEMYLDRLRKGSVSRRETAEVVSDRGIAVVLDAGHAFGHLTGRQAIGIAVDKAKQLGAGIVAVRHGFHFGVARHYANVAAAAGCIGIVMCNTRPLMPAPGGAERVVGNNPIAIALPSADGPPLALDMAMSEAAMGKIRLLEKSGRPIPPTWATRADGSPTTDPREAIAGMLLPAAGPKGFGLAFMIDLMCGLLSGGAWGEAVKPLYGDAAEPYDCAHLFIAIDVGHFGDPETFRRDAALAGERVRGSARAPGVDQVFTPGEIEWRRRQASGGRVRLPASVAATLDRLSDQMNAGDGRAIA